MSAEEELHAAARLLEEALHLRVNGERAPGGPETWQAWEARTEDLLRRIGPISIAETRTEYGADIDGRFRLWEEAPSDEELRAGHLSLIKPAKLYKRTVYVGEWTEVAGAGDASEGDQG